MGQDCVPCQGTTNAKKLNAGAAYFGSIVLDIFVISITLILRKYMARKEAASEREANAAAGVEGNLGTRDVVLPGQPSGVLPPSSIAQVQPQPQQQQRPPTPFQSLTAHNPDGG